MLFLSLARRARLCTREMPNVRTIEKINKKLSHPYLSAFSFRCDSNETILGSAYFSKKLRAIAMFHVIKGWFDQAKPALVSFLHVSLPSIAPRGSQPLLCSSIKCADTIHSTHVIVSTNLTDVKTLLLPANGLPR